MIDLEPIVIDFEDDDMRDTVGAAIRQLVTVNRLGAICFVTLPLHFPDGSHVTVKIEEAAGGYRVSDSGFSYRQAEAVGAERSFRRVANRLIQKHELSPSEKGATTIHVEVGSKGVYGAICDVALVSWQTADHVRQALELNRLDDFIAQEEAHGVGTADRADLARAIYLDTLKAIRVLDNEALEAVGAMDNHEGYHTSDDDHRNWFTAMIDHMIGEAGGD